MKEVGREVIFQQGCFSRCRIWYAGHICGINGKFVYGWRGEKQTMVCKDINDRYLDPEWELVAVKRTPDTIH